jgi:hypothetical protein
MKLRTIILTSTVAVCAGLISGCDDDKSVPQQAGDATEKAAEKTGDAMEKAADKTGEAAEKTGDKVHDATH